VIHLGARTGLIAFACASLALVSGLVAPPAAYATPGWPTTIVAIGDSGASGEGGGSYAAGTRGERGDWCHRSANAYVQRTGLSTGVINLACSGAASENVAFGSAVHNAEGSQAQQLTKVAGSHRITTVVAQFGANDDPAFGDLVVQCVLAYLNPNGPGCASSLAPQFPARVAAMRPKVVAALQDVRSAMRSAGYADTDYVLVVASYASPVSENMVAEHGFIGCPFRKTDAQWGRTEAVPQLSAGLHQAAEQVGARFLDLSRATEGHEACSSKGREWVRRLTVNVRAFQRDGFQGVDHVAQESFHPNATGDAQFGRCLGELLQSSATSAECLTGSDGNIHAQAEQSSNPVTTS
jgi:hypothetical protein